MEYWHTASDRDEGEEDRQTAIEVFEFDFETPQIRDDAEIVNG